MSSDNAPKTLEDWLVVAKQQILEANDPRKGLSAVKQAFKLDPNSPSAWNLAGIGLRELGQMAAAIDAFDKAIQYDSQNWKPRLNRGHTRDRLEQYEAALADYDQVIALNPESVDAWYGKACIHYQLKQYQAALDAYEQILRRQPDRADVWRDKSHMLFELNHHEAALQAAQTALKLAPINTDYRYTYAMFLGLTQQDDLALIAYQTVLKLQPPSDRAPTYEGLGNVLWRLKHYQAALSAYESSLELKDDQPDLWYRRALLLDDMGRFEGAISSYNKVLELNPDHPTVHRDCAWENMHLNRMAQARALLTEAIDRHPQDAEAHYAMASCYGWQGQAPEAIDWLQKAVNLDPQYRQKSQKDGAFSDLAIQSARFRQFLRDLVVQ
jgi:tetratricopeptide (TPR) repeat protein